MEEKAFENSSFIKHISYDDKRKEMTIHFVSGYVHTYDKVPKEVWEEAIKTPSIGKFFHSRIKGHYI